MADVFSAAEMAAMSEENRDKILQLVSEVDRLKRTEGNAKKYKVEADQEIFELTAKMEKLADEIRRLSEDKHNLLENQESLRKTKCDLSTRLGEAERSSHSHQQAKLDFERRLKLSQEEKDSLNDLLKRKKEQIGSMEAEMSATMDRVRSLVNEKGNFQMKLDELESKRLQLEAQEERWNEQKKLLEADKSYYIKELAARDEKVRTAQTEMTRMRLKHESEKFDMLEQQSQCKLELEGARAKVSTLEKQLKVVEDSLRQAHETSESEKKNFEAQIVSLTEANSEYKRQLDDDQTTIDQLTKSLSEINSLYEESKEVVTQTREELRAHNEEIDAKLNEKEEELFKVREELNHAEEALKSTHRVLLTDAEISAISPGAAAASKLIKDNISITSIYHEHVKVVDQLAAQKRETERVECMFHDLVREVESKAPALRRTRQMLEKSEDECIAMRKQLDFAAEAERRLQRTNDQLQRELFFHRTQLEKQHRESADLARQVRQLTFEVEKIRRDPGALETSTLEDFGTEPSAEDLLLFRNIEELQAANQKLVERLRELEATRDEVIKQTQQAERDDMRRRLELAEGEISSLQEHYEAARERAAELAAQRDNYLRMLEEDGRAPVEGAPDKLGSQAENGTAATQMDASAAASPKKSPGKKPISESELAELKMQLEEALRKSDMTEKEMQFYKREMHEKEKLLQTQLDRAQSALSESRSTAAKLSAELEYQNRRFDVAASNVDTYKMEVDSWQAKYSDARATIAKYEERVEFITTELEKTTSQCSRLKCEANSLREQLDSVSQAERRLQSELTAVKDIKKSDALVMSSIQQLEARLNRAESSEVGRLKEEVESLKAERANMVKQAETASEQHTFYVNDLKDRVANLQSSLEKADLEKDAAAKKCEEMEDKINFMCNTESKLRTELKQLRQLSSEGANDRYQHENSHLKTRLQYMELQHNEQANKLKEFEEALESAKRDVDRLRQTGESALSSREELKKSSELEKERLQSSNVRLQSELSAARGDVDRLTQALEGLQRQLGEVEATAQGKENALTQEKLSLRTDLEAARSEVEKQISQIRQLNMDAESTANHVEHLRQSLAVSDGNVRKLTGEIDKLREASTSLKNELASAQAKLVAAETLGDLVKSTQFSAEKSLRTELAAVSQKHDDLVQRNVALAENFHKLSARMEMSGGIGKIEADTGDGESSGAQISDSLRYLRDELRTASTRVQQADDALQESRANETAFKQQVVALTAQLAELRHKTQIQEAELAEKAELKAKLQALDRMRVQVESLKKKVEYEQSSVSMLSKQRDMFRDEIMKLSEEKEKTANALEAAQSSATESRRQVDEWRKRYDAAVEEHTHAESQRIHALRAELSQWRTQHGNAETQIAQLQEQLNATQDERDTFSSRLKDLEQALEMKEAQYKEMSGKFEKVRQIAIRYKREETARQKQAATENPEETGENAQKLAAATEELAVANEQISAVNEQLAAANERIAALERDKEASDAQVAAMKDDLSKANVRVDELKAMCASTVDKTQSQINTFKRQAEDSARERAILQQQLDQERNHAGSGTAPRKPASSVAPTPSAVVSTGSAAAGAAGPSSVGGRPVQLKRPALPLKGARPVAVVTHTVTQMAHAQPMGEGSSSSGGAAVAAVEPVVSVSSASPPPPPTAMPSLGHGSAVGPDVSSTTSSSSNLRHAIVPPATHQRTEANQDARVSGSADAAEPGLAASSIVEHMRKRVMGRTMPSEQSPSEPQSKRVCGLGARMSPAPPDAPSSSQTSGMGHRPRLSAAAAPVRAAVPPDDNSIPIDLVDEGDEAGVQLQPDQLLVAQPELGEHEHDEQPNMGDGDAEFGEFDLPQDEGISGSLQHHPQDPRAVVASGGAQQQQQPPQLQQRAEQPAGLQLQVPPRHHQSEVSDPMPFAESPSSSGQASGRRQRAAGVSAARQQREEFGVPLEGPEALPSGEAEPLHAEPSLSGMDELGGAAPSAGDNFVESSTAAAHFRPRPRGDSDSNEASSSTQQQQRGVRGGAVGGPHSSQSTAALDQFGKQYENLDDADIDMIIAGDGGANEEPDVDSSSGEGYDQPDDDADELVEDDDDGLPSGPHVSDELDMAVQGGPGVRPDSGPPSAAGGEMVLGEVEEDDDEEEEGVEMDEDALRRADDPTPGRSPMHRALPLGGGKPPGVAAGSVSRRVDILPPGGDDDSGKPSRVIKLTNVARREEDSGGASTSGAAARLHRSQISGPPGGAAGGVIARHLAPALGGRAARGKLQTAKRGSPFGARGRGRAARE